MLLSSTQRKIAICLALMTFAGSAIHATVYGLKSQASSASIPPTYLYKFAEDRSGFSIIGQVKVGTTSIDADGLAISASKGLFAFRIGGGGSTLLKINESTGAATPIGALLAGRGIRGAVFDQSDRLLVLDARNDQLAEVNPETGSLVGSPIPVMLGTSRFDVHTISDIAQRADGTFFLINGRQVFRLNVITGALILQFRDDIANGGTPYISHAGATFSTGAGANDLFVYDINGTDDIYQYDLPSGATSRRLIHRDIVSSFNAGRGDLAALSFSVRASVPIADAGPDQSVGQGERVTLDGSGSFDPDGDYPLSYEWAIRARPEGSVAALDTPNSPRPSLVPDRSGSYSIELVVTDARGLRSVADEVLVSTGNVPPVAIAGPDQAIVLVGTTVQLDGSGSYDADGDPLTYEWMFLTRPEGSLAELGDSSAPDPTFVPDVYGDYVLRLVVTDIFGAANEDLVTVSFNNVAPIADTAADRDVTVGETVDLDGSGSSDPNGDSLTYSWSFVLKPEGSAAAFTTPTEARTSFLADLAGDYIVSLVVHDGLLDSTPNNVAIHVNTPPVAMAGPDQEVILIGSTVQLDADESHDADGDPLTYRWTVLTRPEGSLAELSAPSARNPTLMPDMYGDYALRLVATDIHGAEDEDLLTIRFLNLAPIAHAGANQEVVAGDTVNLDGGGSSDPNG
ncbi:MAG TPA: PKD domain-containing protein, partial [Thermoanaerobaculia bacterium]